MGGSSDASLHRPAQETWMTVREFIDDCKRRLLPLYGKEEAASLASRALEDIFNISRTRQITYPETEIENPETVISRLESGEPIQYIAGFEYFCGEKFKVGPGVLSQGPRQKNLSISYSTILNAGKSARTLLRTRSSTYAPAADALPGLSIKGSRKPLLLKPTAATFQTQPFNTPGTRNCCIPAAGPCS